MERNLVFGSHANFDRVMVEPNLDRVDAIIPVRNTKDNWEDCLDSFYREIPINRLLIGDGGCTDDTIDMVRKYPRVTIFDHSKFKTLGYSIKWLIMEVETDWFVYLHSDVSLPYGWYDEMCKYREKWVWFECRRFAVFPDGKIRELTQQFKNIRAYSGSQMGKTAILRKAIHTIEDDYIQRTEDIIIQQYVEALGYKYGKAPTAHHYHYLSLKKSNREQQIEIYEQTLKAIIKYLAPSQTNCITVEELIKNLMTLDAFNRAEWRTWIKDINPKWKIKIFNEPFTTLTSLRVHGRMLKQKLSRKPIIDMDG